MHVLLKIAGAAGLAVAATSAVFALRPPLPVAAAQATVAQPSFVAAAVPPAAPVAAPAATAAPVVATAPVQAKLAAAMRASAGSAALAPVAAPAPVVSAALGPKAGEAPKATPEATMPTPAPSAPPAVAVASNPDPAAEPANAPAGVGDVTLRGLRALALGDVASARLYLRAAADAGDARATYALGVAYDPLTLKKIGARVETGDSDKAREFYLKALAAGFADARTRLASLSP